MRLKEMLSGACLDWCFQTGIDLRRDQIWESQI